MNEMECENAWHFFWKCHAFCVATKRPRNTFIPHASFPKTPFMQLSM